MLQGSCPPGHGDPPLAHVHAALETDSAGASQLFVFPGIPVYCLVHILYIQTLKLPGFSLGLLPSWHPGPSWAGCSHLRGGDSPRAFPAVFLLLGPVPPFSAASPALLPGAVACFFPGLGTASQAPGGASRLPHLCPHLRNRLDGFLNWWCS